MLIQRLVEQQIDWFARTARVARRRIRRLTFRRRTEEKIIFGRPFLIDIADQKAESWYGGGRQLFPSFRFLVERERFASYRNIYYLGAHHCVLAMGLSRLVDPAARIFAVEADPFNCKVARSNIRSNGTTNIELIHAAVSDSDGAIFFDGRRAVKSPNASVPVIEVPTVTIDTLISRYGRPDLVIIDIEGFEQKAISASPEAISSGADWCVEVHINSGLEAAGGSLAEVAGFFARDRYGQFASQEFGAEPTLPLDLEHPPSRSFHLLAIQRAVAPGASQAIECK
jgi:FkbM family methyltransferase